IGLNIWSSSKGMIIEKEFVFDAAHFLPYVHEKHKCRRLHGHTYTVTIRVEGDLNAIGWVVDFADITKVVQPILHQLDHTLLNAVHGLENPTAEIIAMWIYERVKENIKGVRRVTVQEGFAARAIYPHNA
ncbi:MAG TPA: 6-carboxytetrahydropterin synthase QueD, partial [Turneriella sp.]|nr:6-carboxytetrahydropterin synthase QueD [Turneriella sp.]